jgi:hypothetical protein
MMAFDIDAMTPAQKAEWERLRQGKRHKFAAQATTYKGVKYQSKAEAERARYLDSLKHGGLIAWWLRQVPVQLGEDTVYRIDFQVGVRLVGADGDIGYIVRAEDVKGVETRAFVKIKKLWRKYGPFPLDVIALKHKDWVTRTVEGGQQC